MLMRVLVGFGLVVMLSAAAYFGFASDLARVEGRDYASIASTSFWAFLAGAAIAMAASFAGARRS
jgi:hypothetical protein